MTDRQSTPPWSVSATSSAVVLLAILAAAAYYVGATGLVAVDASQPFRPVAYTVAIPVALFVAAYRLSPRLRQFVLAQDLRTLTMLQLWRVLEFAFLFLYAHDTLPALFAWPAGFGDILIGFTAPLIVARLNRDPNFATSHRFLTFHALGLVDFALAVTAATFASGAYPALYDGALTSAPMETWPLNLFPSFFVPLFIIAHIVVILRVGKLRRRAQGGTAATLKTASR